MSKPNYLEPGAIARIHGHDLAVEKSCELDRGAWYCATHGYGFRNNMETDGHLRDHPATKTCDLVWNCHEHGWESA